MSIVVVPAVDDYTRLVSDIEKHLHRIGDAALQERIPHLIALAENDLFRELPLRQTETYFDGTTTTAYISVPGGVASLERVVVTINGVDRTLDYVQPGRASLYSASGEPIEFAVENAQIRLFPAPASAYTYRVHYIPNFEPLTESSLNNWLTTNAYDAYLFGCLIQASIWADDDGTAARYIPIYQRALDSIRRKDERRRLPISGGLQIKPRNAR